MSSSWVEVRARSRLSRREPGRLGMGVCVGWYAVRMDSAWTLSFLKSAWIHGLPQTSLLSPTTIGCRSKHVLYIPRIYIGGVFPA